MEFTIFKKEDTPPRLDKKEDVIISETFEKTIIIVGIITGIILLFLLFFILCMTLIPATNGFYWW